MIGTDSGVYSLCCDLCGESPTAVFESKTAPNKYAEKHNWIKIEIDAEDKHICPICTEKIIVCFKKFEELIAIAAQDEEGKTDERNV